MPKTKKKRSDPEPILDFDEEKAHLSECEQGDTHNIPIRTCVTERARKEKPFLLRFVVSPEDEVVPDIKGNLPGRGVWVTAGRKAVGDAVKRRAFQRVFRRPVTVSESLSSEVEQLFKRSVLERLSICNKAGLVVTGFQKVDDALKRREIVVLLHADSAAADGKDKLDRKFKALYSGANHIEPENCFTSAEISLATGSTNVIHAGLKEGGATTAFLQALVRFSGYCASEAKPHSLRQDRE
ncbi:RNA-binding protein [Rhodomicrobium sp. Az07]|uniref:RNA-binding protein n=1 Tax=Rhodomicrobium sp. Az07 TaxID=2839034 RepID=UPI001BE881C3|nr:RNA-binding protein [Rhodomicrobium sp. Az07]MBT3071232.1 RNA-binding protein [Rhodomicrobium sp. Az07]